MPPSYSLLSPTTTNKDLNTMFSSMKIYDAGTIYVPVITTLIISMSPSSGYAKSLSSQDFSLSQPVTITVIFLVSFFFGFVTLYICRCVLENLARLRRNNQRNPAPQGDVGSTAGENRSDGLDPELIQAFPTFFYSTVKEFRREKYGLECAICLGEFNDDHMLRLLTICCHVFHKECIDLWLESHKTCPVCRGELDVPRKSLEKSPLLVRSNSMHEIGSNRSSLEDSICIDIKDDKNEKVDAREDEASNTREKQLSKRERFSRSHSTGHSITRSIEEDRYTLRLPDHIKRKIVRGHHVARSCIVFGELTSPSDDRSRGSGKVSETDCGDQHRLKEKILTLC